MAQLVMRGRRNIKEIVGTMAIFLGFLFEDTKPNRFCLQVNRFKGFFIYFEMEQCLARKLGLFLNKCIHFT